MTGTCRTGVDLGGTKIEAVVLDPEGAVLVRQRVPTPRGDYAATVQAITQLVHDVESRAGCRPEHVGVGVPGSPSPRTGLMRNCNSTVLNGRDLGAELMTILERPVRLTNDANCLALSEAHDGAAAGARSVFAVILGTGVGGGLVIDGHLISGTNGVGGEWGHMPLPWPTHDEVAGTTCWCGQSGCLETWLAGPALEAQARSAGCVVDRATDLASLAASGDDLASGVLDRWLDRLARALSVIINVVDPEVFVVGGGLNAIDAIYHEIPRRWERRVFSDTVQTRIVRAQHGDSSGVLGAARL